MYVCCECCVFSSRDLCDKLIIYREKSYRLWCVVACDLETSWMRRPWPALGRSATTEICRYIYKFVQNYNNIRFTPVISPKSK